METIETITKKSKNEAHIHYVVAFIGGFLGLYPILSIANIFGSSQTSNLMECVLSLIERKWTNLIFHILGALIYSFSVFLVTFINHRKKSITKYFALTIDIFAAIIMFVLPKNLPAIFYLYPTFFAMSFQWSSFSGAYGFVCSTIFSTNNLKQLISSLTEVFFNGKKEFSLKAKFFGATLFSFNFGVAICFVLWNFLGNIAFLGAIIPCFITIIMLYKKS